MHVPSTRLLPLAFTLAAAITLWTALPASAADQAPRYRIKPLPQHMGAADINNLGEVAGTVKIRGGVTRGAVWRDGQLQWLPTAPGDFRLVINAINDRGEVVGQATGQDRNSRPVLFRDGGMVELFTGFAQRPTSGAATDINNDGVSTGWVLGPHSSVTRPVIHDGNTARTLQIDPSSARGLDINEAGDVLMINSQYSYDLYRNRNGTVTRLPKLAAAPGVTAYHAINNVGQVLGSVTRFTSSPAQIQWAIWHNGRAQIIDAPQDATPALAFNDQGWLVGQWNGHLGFLHRDGQTYALEDLIDPAVAGRWRGGAITGINEAGQMIGYGYFFNRGRAFVATPVPEPATVVLMLAGLCAMGWSALARQQRASD